MVKYIREEWKTSQTIFREFSESFQMGDRGSLPMKKNLQHDFPNSVGGQDMVWLAKVI